MINVPQARRNVLKIIMGAIAVVGFAGELLVMKEAEGPIGIRLVIMEAGLVVARQRDVIRNPIVRETVVNMKLLRNTLAPIIAQVENVNKSKFLK
jgi:hypothetical protein